MSKFNIVHIEFSTLGREASAKFYSDLFGWKTEQMPEMNYATFDTEAGLGGGFSPVQEGNPAGTVLVYIDTDDIDATLTKAVTLGGKTLATKTEIPGIGWFGLFADPSGNMVGLFTALNPQP